MSNDLIVGFSGNISRPSRTRRFAESLAASLAKQAGLQHTVFDVEDLDTSLAAARSVADLDPAARKVIQTIVEAEALVIGSPTYKGSYTGLFKHDFDLLDPADLRGKTRHPDGNRQGRSTLLVVEHQHRPQFAFFEACSANGNLRLEPRFHRWQTVNGYTRSRKPGAGGGLHPRAGALRSRRNCSGISTRPARA
ncbi:putative flavoprotein [Rhizobium sp. CF122]|uniref:NADPH-dependent FMN reductase n=1 Tax=Rhizobium sp. CF122 TaxID=1144312 RepID=UPI000271CB6F|nr:putative flavoprotein [Rhizobium sp. CF122]